MVNLSRTVLDLLLERAILVDTFLNRMDLLQDAIIVRLPVVVLVSLQLVILLDGYIEILLNIHDLLHGISSDLHLTTVLSESGAEDLRVLAID